MSRLAERCAGHLRTLRTFRGLLGRKMRTTVCAPCAPFEKHLQNRTRKVRSDVRTFLRTFEHGTQTKMRSKPHTQPPLGGVCGLRTFGAHDRRLS